MSIDSNRAIRSLRTPAMHSLREDHSATQQLLLYQEVNVVDPQRRELLVRALHIQQQPTKGDEYLTITNTSQSTYVSFLSHLQKDIHETHIFSSSPS